MANRVHSVSKLLRMTPEEAKLLKENALGANMGESAYLRLMISQKPNDELATLFWAKLLRTRNYFNYSSYPADFRVFNPLYSTGVR